MYNEMIGCKMNLQGKELIEYWERMSILNKKASSNKQKTKSNIDWESDVPMTKSESKQALNELLKGRVNQCEMVCPICNDWESVGSTYGLAFCGCGFQSDKGSLFNPETCPAWIKEANYVQRWSIYYKPFPYLTPQLRILT